MRDFRKRLAVLVDEFVSRVEELVRTEMRGEVRRQAESIVTQALLEVMPARAARASETPPVETSRARRPTVPTKGRAGRPTRQATPVTPAASRPSRDKPGPATPERAPVLASRGKAGRRSNVRMQRDLEAIVAYVRGHPGSKMEDIAAAVRSTSQRLNTPMHRLLSDGTLMRAGAKRATRYWLREEPKNRNAKPVAGAAVPTAQPEGDHIDVRPAALRADDAAEAELASSPGHDAADQLPDATSESSASANMHDAEPTN